MNDQEKIADLTAKLAYYENAECEYCEQSLICTDEGEYKGRQFPVACMTCFGKQVEKRLEAEAKLAAAMEALGGLAKEAHRILFSPNTGTSGSSAASYEHGAAESARILGRMADKAIANIDPAAKRLRAIEKAAEERKEACQYPPGYCDTCDDRMICKAVREEGG